MNYRVYSGYGSFTIRIDLETSTPQKIMIKAYDENLKNTCFTNRYDVVIGKKSYWVRMPVSGQVTVIEIYNDANGNQKADNSFKVKSITKVPLERKLDVVDFKDGRLKRFVKFATRFCFNAGVMEPGFYPSAGGEFKILYNPEIISSVNKQVLGTPARINKDTGQIELSRNKFIEMTVPMRMAILLHEYSHFYINTDINSETEADLNALTIYLGLGYPRIEACEAFLVTFQKSAQGPTPLNEAQKAANANRYNIIHRFIEEFENRKLVIK